MKSSQASALSSVGYTSSPETAVHIDNVSVKYRAYHQRSTSFKESMINFMRGKKREEQVLHALSNVTFSVQRGQTFAIMGSNGCGKSTLLKVIAGVLKPSSGSVAVTGSLASLIELGVGFDSELNAIENIYLHGSLYKKSKREIAMKVDSILDFAELREFADMPIKYYSSGMTARLGFATAIDIDPDVLLVDEILGVGDERFQGKCRDVFDRFINGGKTVIIVSHDLALIERVASAAALLSNGRLVFLGETAKGIAMYRDATYVTRLGGLES